MSRSRGTIALRASAAISSAHKSSPGATCGKPSSAAMVSSVSANGVIPLQFARGQLADAGDAEAGAVDLVGPIDADQNRGQRSRGHRIGKRACMSPLKPDRRNEVDGRLAISSVIAKYQHVAVDRIVL